MYNISDEFKQAIKSANRKSAITGTLTTVKGDVYQLNDKAFIKDSFYITNQCVNNNALEFGTVYAGECGFVINSDIDRYSLFGAKIECKLSIYVTSDRVETLNLGTFYVDSAERIGSKIKITSVDVMSNFDVTVLDDTNGSWYSLLTYIAGLCNVELAQTQAELEALHVNTTAQTYTIRASRIDTYRDALSYLCSVICAFATIDNDGKLKILQYAISAVDSNDRNTRLNNCSFSDYVTRYNSVTARFVAEENYYPYTAVDQGIDGMLLDMGDIPIVGGTPTTKQKLLDAMLATIKKIEYTPSTLYIASNPAYELGDMIECDNINNGNDSVNILYMKYKYEYRKKETVNCYGENPLLQNVKDKSSKQLDSLEQQVSTKDVVMVTFNNSDSYEIKQDLKEIAALNFSTNSVCRPILLASIPFTLDLDGYVEFNIYNSLIPIDNAIYKGYYAAGSHFATIFYLDDCKQNDRKNLRILARTYLNEESVERQNTADILTYNNAFTALKAVTSIDDINNLEYVVEKPDTTQPTMTIAGSDLRAIIYSQGIDSGVNWDGTLEFTEQVENINIVNAAVESFSDSVATSQLNPECSGINENITDIEITNVAVDAFVGNIEEDYVTKNYTVDADKAKLYSYDAEFVDSNQSYTLNTDYTYTSTPQSIDSGYMCRIDFDFTQFAEVSEVDIK